MTLLPTAYGVLQQLSTRAFRQLSTKHAWFLQNGRDKLKQSTL